MQQILPILVSVCLNVLMCESNDSNHSMTRSTFVIGPANVSLENDSNCTSLEEVASIVKEHQLTDVEINFRISGNDSILLNTRITFENLSNVTINGGPEGATINCTGGGVSTSMNSDGAGIVLSGVRGTVVLNNLTLQYCGTKLEKGNKKYSSALSLIRCNNIELSNITIAQSNGIGLMMVKNSGGNVSIKSSSFSRNKLLEEHSDKNGNPSLLGGGGVYVQLESEQSSQLSTNVEFVQCRFENNTSSNNVKKYFITNSWGVVKEGYGQGGGVSLYIRSSSNVHVSFSECEFIGNEAFIGGGLSVNVHGNNDYKKENSITVQIIDTLFWLNGCNETKYTYFGGGICLRIREVLSSLDRVFLMKNVSFANNCAEMGGGLYFASDLSRRTPKNDSVFVDNCTFAKNQANMGSAIDISPTDLPDESKGHMVCAKFKNCNFLENHVTVNHSSHDIVQIKIPGLGTVRISQRNVYFEGNNCFKSNKGSAVYVINGIVNFQKSNATFINNFALYGGAVDLLGSSTIIVGPNTYKFINNTAIHNGGAIAVYSIDSFNFRVSRACFIQYADENNRKVFYRDWNANIIFIGNRVLKGSTGHTIYATSLHYCQFFVENDHDDIIVNITQVFIERGITIHNDSGHELATDGAYLNSTNQIPLEIIPGENYKHGVSIYDDFHQKSATLFQVEVMNQSDEERVNLNLTTFVNDELQLTGNPNQNKALKLVLYTVSPREAYISLKMTLLECPPGFKLNENKTCICNTSAYVGLYMCDKEKFQSYLLHGYWVGYLDNGLHLVTTTCPFCEYQPTSLSDFGVVLPRNSSDLDRTVCGERRTGVLCGRCREGYTVHFHSPGYLCQPAEPVECKLGWLFYILSELLPVTVVFITVLVLNISFTSGGVVSSFIFFSQLLDSFDINASGITTYAKSIRNTIDTFTSSYKFIYGFSNLDVFDSEKLSFCLWKNATIVEIVAFKYVTIVYILLLIMAVMFFMNNCGGRYCCGKYCRITNIRKSIIHGISSFLVICYTKLVYNSIILISPVHVNVELNSGYKPDPRIWMNGEIVYFSKEHLPYALPALLLLSTIGLLPPVLFLCYPLLNKILSRFGCEDSKVAHFLSCHYCITNLKPLLDVFQSCFKDNMRFFAGLYFLYRWIFFLAFAVTRDYGSYYTVVGCALLGILALHIVCQPYNKREHNIIDALLLINLVLINLLSFYNFLSNYYQRGVDHRSTVAPAIIQLILIHLPLVVVCVYALVCLFKKINNHSRLRSLISFLVPRSAGRIRNLILPRRNKDECSDASLVEMACDDDIEYERYMDRY